jgi:hypothetical protein
MHNWYGIETEAAFRRREMERAAKADIRSGEALSTRPKFRRVWLPHVALARLRSLTAPRFSFTTALEPRCRTATCL